MWFEVTVRLSEVTNLKWPHGTEWQCGNSTLAMSWPNHVQILSFASIASRQGAVKHGFVSKIAGGCSSYDVIAPWPDLTWSFFYQKLRKVCPIRCTKTRRRVAPPFLRYLRKTSGGGGCTNPPVRARVQRRRIVFWSGGQIFSQNDGVRTMAVWGTTQNVRLTLWGIYVGRASWPVKRPCHLFAALS